MLTLDISNYGGELPASVVADWKTAGVEKVVVGVDLRAANITLARRQLAAARNGGVRLGAYRFCYWASDIEASLRLTASALAGFNIEDVALDFEDDVPNQPELVCAWIQNCLDIASRVWGRERVILYTAAWWWNPNTNSTTRFKDWPLWVAQYDGDSSSNFNHFGGWQTCFRKQFLGSSDICHYTADVNYEEDDMDAATEQKLQRAAVAARWAGLIATVEPRLVALAVREMLYCRVASGVPLMPADSELPGPLK